MSAIILPPGIRGWHDFLRPRQGEPEQLLQTYVGTDWWRTPKRKMEELWLLKRPELNHMLGLREFKGPRRQRGSVSAFAYGPVVPAGAAPALSTITNTYTTAAPDNPRQSIMYANDGTILWDEVIGAGTGIVYAVLTTQTDDANDHTYEWWDAAPSASIGASYDIRYTAAAFDFIFTDGTDTDRTINTWYLIQTVAADGGDGITRGCLQEVKPAGTAKTPSPGTDVGTATVEIRATGSGSALASHSITLTCTAT